MGSLLKRPLAAKVAAVKQQASTKSLLIQRSQGRVSERGASVLGKNPSSSQHPYGDLQQSTARTANLVQVLSSQNESTLDRSNSFVISKRPSGTLILTKAAFDRKPSKDERKRIFQQQSAKSRRFLQLNYGHRAQKNLL